MNKPLITIILPTYNGVKWIEKSIRSALRQSFANFELLVINDCSHDDTEGLILSLMKEDPRIVYLRNDTNLGLAKTLNVGLGMAKGEYIARLDQDDEWIDEDKLRKQVEFLSHNPEYVLIGTGTVMVDDTGAEIGRFLMPSTDSEIRSRLLRTNCFIHTSVVFRTKSAKDIGGYSSEKMSEDHDLWLRLGRTGKLANLARYSVQYLFHPAGLNSQNKALRLKQNLLFAEEHKDFYPNYVVSIISGWAKIIFYPIFNLMPSALKGVLLKIHKKI